MKRVWKQLLSLVLSLVLVLGYMPAAAWAEDAGTSDGTGSDAGIVSGSVRVIIENNTFTRACADSQNKSPAWTGLLLDTYVDLDASSTMMSCVTEALGEYSQTGAASNYITEINGLEAGACGTYSGWMGMLNDWFTSQGFASYTVEAGTLEAGDEIHLVYSLTMGEDCGASFNNQDKTIKSVDFLQKSDSQEGSAWTPAGELDRKFSKTDHNEYVLHLPESLTSLALVPTASNKNYQAKIFLGGKEYKRNALIPVAEGSLITLVCGDPSWPSMNATGDSATEPPAQSYSFRMTYAPVEEKPQILLPATGCYTADDGKIFLTGKKNDKIQLSVKGVADPSKVTWKSSSTTNASIDNTGLLTFKKDFTSSSAVKITASLDGAAIATVDLNLTEAFHLTKTPAASIALPASNLETATAKVSVTASLALAQGFVDWKLTGEDLAQITTDLSSGPKSSIDLNLKRPGKVSVTALFNPDHSQDQTATFTITGIALEPEGQDNGRIAISSQNPSPTLRLQAYLEEGAQVTGWTSSDPEVAGVDSQGLVTGHKTGIADITATDDKGNTGSYRVEVVEEGKPYFDHLEFLTTPLVTGTWVANTTYIPTKTEYDMPLKTATTSTISTQTTTAYNTDLYTAEAHYTNVDGEEMNIAINSGRLTSLEKMPFDDSILTITIAEIANPENKTVYTFKVNRPRDTTKTIKATSGIVIEPEGRALSPMTYKGKAEGTMFQTDNTGIATTTSGVAAAKYYYRAYLLDQAESFRLTLASSNDYGHIRYSLDEGETWSQDGQKLMATDYIKVTPGQDTKVQIQILDDKTWSDNIKAGKDGFADSEPTNYYVWVEKIDVPLDAMQIKTAEVDQGDFYPAFDPSRLTYTIVVPNGTTTADFRYTVSEDASVKSGTAAQKPDENGVYTLALTTTAKTLTISTADGFTNTYSFKIKARSAKAYADRVVDYLTINSQYSNGDYSDPLQTLSGSLASLGNFGGYITYYFDQPLTDNPNNRYGMDFYAYGNAFIVDGTDSSQGSAENGQVWVSEDGQTWYALAGSEHYEDDIIWDYEITYKKTLSGKTSWTDNQGNSNDGSSRSGAWVNPNFYYLNKLAKGNEITMKGILMPSSQGTITGDGTTDAMAHKASFGYVDYYPTGTVGEDVNPYIDKPVNANGFDLAWAVDEEGRPVDVTGMEFHYIKVVTANNIWDAAINEKSTESSGVLRTTALERPVGKTDAPRILVNNSPLPEEGPVYVDGPFTVSVEASEESNVYINNQRTTSASFQTVPSHGYIRVIAQEGDKEAAYATIPLVYIDTTEAKNVDAMIEALGTITLDSKAAIDAAEAAYEALSDQMKAYVTKLDTLNAARTTYAELKAKDDQEKAYAARPVNKIKATNLKKVTNTVKKTYAIKATTLGGAKLTYSSANKKITVSKTGVITVPANFVGKAVITIKAAANDQYKAASKKITIRVYPQKTALVSLKNTKSKVLTIKWKRNSRVTGYQLQVCPGSGFKKNVKKFTIQKNKTLSKQVRKLKKNKTYYVRIRTYKTVNKIRYCSGWSGVKKLKIKK